MPELEQRSTILDDLAAAVHHRLPAFDPPTIRRLVDCWVQHLDDDELRQLEPDQLAGLVAAALELAGRRTDDETLVQVLAPQRGGQPCRVLVVAQDRPFTVDTVALALTRCGWAITELLHPQLVVRRDGQGRLVSAAPAGTEDGGRPESWVGVLARPPFGEDVEQAVSRVQTELERGLSDLRRAVDDADEMRAAMARVADELRTVELPAHVDETERTSAVDLLDYLLDGHFTFLASREHVLRHGELVPVPGSGLGTLRGDDAPSRFNAVPTREPVFLQVVTKDLEHSRVHRGALRDYVGVRTFDAEGRVAAEHRFLGLLAPEAYTASVMQVPPLADKARQLVASSGYEPGSHGAQAVLQVLESLPRDELFHASVEELKPVVSSISQLKERRQVRLFLREGEWGGRLTALVYFPRDRYNTALRHRMEKVLREATGATSIDFQTEVSESVLARLYFVMELPGDEPVPVDVPALQRRLTEVTQDWTDDFSELADELSTQARGIDFGEAYTERYTPRQGLADLHALNRAAAGSGMEFAMYAPDDAEDYSDLRLKVLRVGSPMRLQDVMPHLVGLGVRVLDERPFELVLRGRPAMVYDFGLALPGGREAWDERRRALVTDAFRASWDGLCDVDELNVLVTRAGFTWRQVLVLRSVARYVRQLGSTFSLSYLAQALEANLPVTRGLVELFEARFDPTRDQGRDAAVSTCVEQLQQALDEVQVLDHDRILRQFLEVVQATVRTNLYSDDLPAVALKTLPGQISFAPEPRPAHEIFVHSPRIEGVHLRFGAVARGGLRWSDRSEDFRTEALGLAKAQMVKNTVIVPVGAKGAFVARQLPNPAEDRQAWFTEGQEAYKVFIAALLSVTDNIVDATVVGPQGVVRHDEDDPYLVVAADKGTATFSDLANAISLERGFWLGDAFASGGSIGYDHKAMGITAKGAWESVKQHFHEMGVDCQAEDFTAVGIGDMAGDVFGNGMMLSRHTCLVAAFNHQHVFLDPHPDAARSFDERVRLFNLPRSTWADYDASLISEGGGVFERSAKSIPVSPQVREVLGITDGVDHLPPTELIRAILAAPVDLLWNGGIGTYVKGSQESHQQVGDKANDAVRLNGDQVRAKVAGEGGNLGWTQLGRIEYASSGGRINTDFIDNSAGVDTSDHEVNIKILLDGEVAAGRLSPEERNALLPRMTDDVASLVLAHNVDQNLTLANSRATASAFAGVHEEWMRLLEHAGYLDRGIESMPSSQEMRQRISDGKGLTSPELATLLAWSKIWLSDQILASDLPDDPFVGDRLVQYFPPLLRERYREQMQQHRLHRDIITTVAVNRFVNSQGMTAVHRLTSETGATPAAVIRAQLAARSIFDAGKVEVKTRKAGLDADTQTRMRLALRQLVEQGTRWILHREPAGIDVRATIDRYHDGVAALAARLPELLAPQARARYDEQLAEVLDAGVDADLAAVAVGAQWGHLLPQVVAISQELDVEAALVARVQFALAERLGLDRMLERIEALPRSNRWNTLARSAVRDDLLAAQAELTANAVRAGGRVDDPEAVLDAWTGQLPGIAQRQAVLDEVLDADPDLARLSVGLRTVRSLV